MAKSISHFNVLLTFWFHFSEINIKSKVLSFKKKKKGPVGIPINILNSQFKEN